MIVGLILEIDEPLLFFPIDIDRNNDGACVDLIRFFLIVKFSLRLQLLGSEECKIHQADELVASSGIESIAVSQILLKRILEGLLHVALAELNFFKLGLERRVTAVVGPVCVEYADLSDRGVALLLVLEIFADELEVRECHRKIQGIIQLLELSEIHGAEICKNLNILRLRIDSSECLRHGLIRLTGVDRIDSVLHELLKVLIGDLTDEHIGRRGMDTGILLLIQEADALLCGVRSLVKLARQVLDGKDAVRSLLLRELSFINIIYGRLREHSARSLLKCLICYIFYIIADKDPHILHTFYVQIMLCFVQQIVCLDGEFRLLLHVNSSDHFVSS